MNKELILKTLYYVISSIPIIFFIYQMSTREVHREGMVDSEKLFYTLLGGYPSYQFEKNLIKEVSLTTYATVNTSEISDSEIDAKVNYLQQNGWRKIVSNESKYRLCHGSQNMVAITEWRKDSTLEQNNKFKGKVEFTFFYNYKGNSDCE